MIDVFFAKHKMANELRTIHRTNERRRVEVVMKDIQKRPSKFCDPKTSCETLEYIQCEVSKRGVYEYGTNDAGFSAGAAAVQLERELRDENITRMVETIDTFELEEVCGMLPTKAFQLNFIRKVVDLVASPSTLQSANLLNFVFSHPQPLEASMLSDPIRGFFMSFKTNDPEEAALNTETFKTVLAMSDSIRDKLSSSESMVKAVRYLILSAEEFVEILDDTARLKVASDFNSRKYRYVNLKSSLQSDLFLKAKESLKASYCANVFVSEDEKRKMKLISW